jgi:hypothetical protein
VTDFISFIIGTDGESRDPRLARKSRRQRTVSESAANEDGKNRKRRRTTSESTDTPHTPPESDSSEPKRVKLDSGNNETAMPANSNSKRTLCDAKPEHHTSEDRNNESRKRKLSESDSESSSESEAEQPLKDTAGIKRVRISEDVNVQSPEQRKNKRNRKRNKKTKETTKQEVPELRVITKLVDIILKNKCV